MQQDFLENYNNSTTPWFKTKAFKIGAIVLATIAVLVVVLFSQQIGDLLEFYGLKAATESRTILVDGIGGVGDNYTYFFESGHTVTPPDSFKIDPTTNRLMLN